MHALSWVLRCIFLSTLNFFYCFLYKAHPYFVVQQLCKHSMFFFVSCAAAAAASSSLHFPFKDSLFLLCAFFFHLISFIFILPAILVCSTCKRVNIMHFGIKLQRYNAITTTKLIQNFSAARNNRSHTHIYFELPAASRSSMSLLAILAFVLPACCCPAVEVLQCFVIATATATATTRASFFFATFWSIICTKPTFQGPFALVFCWFLLLILFCMSLCCIILYPFVFNARALCQHSFKRRSSNNNKHNLQAIHDRMSSTMQNLLTKVSF